jgi:hypothetical protein
MNLKKMANSDQIFVIYVIELVIWELISKKGRSFYLMLELYIISKSYKFNIIVPQTIFKEISKR